MVLKDLLKKIFHLLGVYDTIFTPTRLYYRFLRLIGFGVNRSFSVWWGSPITIMMESFHWFNEFFSSDESLLMDKEKRFFCEMAKNQRTLLDIGALYWAFSLTFLSQNPTKNVAYAFDPSPHAFRVLKQHQLLNPSLALNIRNCAVWWTKWTLKMRYNWLHLEVLPDSAEKFDYLADVVTIDSFVKESGVVFDFIKIDCEWSEFFVLQWWYEFLKSHSPVILLELHYKMLLNLWINPSDVFSYLQQLGFSFYDFSKQLIWDVDTYLSAKNAVYFVVCAKSSSLWFE